MTQNVRVELDERSYDIAIGPDLLENFISSHANLLKGTKCAVVTDDNVASLYLERLETYLRNSDAYAGSIVVPAGEQSKSFKQLSDLSEKLLLLNVERGDFVIALGGGVIGDLAGFAASILRRGVRLIQIPTTLLAQVDSSVGGKTGINTPQGKNLIGTFHQPSLVLIDTDLLKTLDMRQFRAGYAEVVKYGLLGDIQFFEWLEDNWQNIFEDRDGARSIAIEKSCIAKARVVASDEKEAGQRALLNLGHTFGHALEAWAGYSGRLLHGEAVSIGMIMAFEFSEMIGLCPSGQTSRVEDHLKAVGLPTRISGIPGEDYPSADVLLGKMMQDKKVKKGKPAFILVNDIGQAFVHSDVPLDDLKAFLGKSC